MPMKEYWSRARRRRLSRRQILGSAAAGGAGLALAACAQAPSKPAGSPTTGGKAAGQAGAADKIAAGHYEKVLAASKEELNAAQNAKRGGTLKVQYLDPPHFDIALSYSCTLYDTHELVYNKAIRAKLGPQADLYCWLALGHAVEDDDVEVLRAVRGEVGAATERLSLIHISEPTRLLSISYSVFCLKKKKNTL